MGPARESVPSLVGFVVAGARPGLSRFRRRLFLAVPKVASISRIPRGDVNWIMDRLHVTPAERADNGATRDAVCKLLMRDVDFQNGG